MGKEVLSISMDSQTINSFRKTVGRGNVSPMLERFVRQFLLKEEEKTVSIEEVAEKESKLKQRLGELGNFKEHLLAQQKAEQEEKENQEAVFKERRALEAAEQAEMEKREKERTELFAQVKACQEQDLVLFDKVLGGFRDEAQKQNAVFKPFLVVKDASLFLKAFSEEATKKKGTEKK